MIIDFLLLGRRAFNTILSRKEMSLVVLTKTSTMYNDANVTVTSDCYTRCQIRSVHFDTTSVIGLY